METKLNAILFQRKWLVLVAAFYGNACSAGLILSLSVMYVEWLDAFGKSKAETAVIQSVLSGIFNISAAFAGVLVTKFGQRKIGIVAGVLTAIGFSLSFFATSIIYLTLVLSTCVGLGMSGLYIASASVIRIYFEGKQNHIALSIISVGVGVGALTFTYLLNFISMEYGWRGCLLLTAGMILQNIPLFAICKPKMRNHEKCQNNNSTIQEVKHSEDVPNNHKHDKKSVCVLLKKLRKNKLFWLNSLASCCMKASFLSCLIIAVDLLQFKGFSRDDAVLLYLIMTITSTATRLLPGLVKQVKHISIFAIAIFHAVTGTLALFILPTVEGFIDNAVVMGCVGFSIAGTLGSVIQITTLKTAGADSFSVGLGITLSLTGVTRIIIGPLTGYFRDVTGVYHTSFYVNGAIALCGVFCYFLLLYCHTSKTNKPVEDYDLVDEEISNKNKLGIKKGDEYKGKMNPNFEIEESIQCVCVKINVLHSNFGTPYVT